MKTIRIIFAITVMASVFLGFVIIVNKPMLGANPYLWVATILCYCIVGATGMTIIIDGHFFKSRDELNNLVIKYRELVKQYNEALTTIGKHEAFKK